MNVKMKRYAKALVAFILALAMVSEAWGGLSFVSEAETSAPETVTVGTHFPESFDSTSTETDYYITTPEELVYFSNASQENNLSGITVHLANDIDYSTGASSSSKFSGIGGGSTSFQGTFDGHGYTISNISLGGHGLFRYVNGATIKNFVVDNATMTTTYDGRGILVSKYNGTGTTIKDVTVKNSSAVTSKISFGVIIGTANSASATIAIKGCTVDNCTITNSASVMTNVGGIAGKLTGGSSITDCKVSGLTIEGTYAQEEVPNEWNSSALAGINPDEVVYSEYIGGAVGYILNGVTVSGVSVEDVTISLGTVFNYVGGFAGYVEGSTGSTFTDCSVSNATIISPAMIWDPSGADAGQNGYYHNMGGFAGCVISPSTFTQCKVDTVTVQTRTRYQFAGGLIGGTIKYTDCWTNKSDLAAASQTGKITVSKCEVEDVSLNTEENRNCLGAGGVVGYLTNGSTITDCGVNNITTAKNTNSQHMAGLVGYVMASTDTTTQTVIKNSYVGSATISGFNFVGELIGNVAATSTDGIDNLFYCKDHCVVKIVKENPATFTHDELQGRDHTYFADGEIAYILNAGDTTSNDSTKIWSQGDGHPTLAGDGQMATLKVIFQAEGESFAYYTNAEGKLDSYPQPDEGYEWWGYPDDTVLQEVFEENTWIYQKLKEPSISYYGKEGYEDETDFYISTKDELKTFRSLSQTNTFEGITIHLIDNIDWGGEDGGEWNGIGKYNAENGIYVPFGGTFDGHGHTIEGLYSTNGQALFVFFGSKDGSIAQPTVKNVTLENAQITSDGNGRAIVVARVMGNPENTGLNSQILNVHVTGSSLTGTGENSNYFGIIVGRNENGLDEEGNTVRTAAVTISGCTVTDTTMTYTSSAAVNRWGFIMGRDLSGGYSRIVGCTVTNCKMISESGNISYVGGVLGSSNGPIEVEECTVDGCNIACAPTASTVQYIGGIVGCIEANDPTILDCTVANTTITTGAVATDVGLAIGKTFGGTISGVKINDSTLNLTYATVTTQSEEIGVLAGSIGRDSTATTLPTVEIDGCETEGNTINIAGVSDSVGGLVGRVNEYVEDVTLKSSNVKNTKINHTLYLNSGDFVGEITTYNVGGVIGCTQADVQVDRVTVEGIQISTKGHAEQIGGFVGCVKGTTGSTFTNCKVTSYAAEDETVTRSRITQQAYGGGKDSTHHFSAFAAYVETESKFTSCMVQSFDCSTNVRTNAFGGIVGAVYNTATPSTFGVVTIDKCSIMDVSVISGSWKDYRIGGVAGAIAEGSSVTNCLVSEFLRSGYRTDQAGILVGNIYNSDTTGDSRFTMKNCYCQNSTVETTETQSSRSVYIDFGWKGLSSLTIQHIKFYNCKAIVNGVTTTTDVYPLTKIETTVVEDVADLADKDLAYALNTTNGTEPNSGSWAQGYDANGNGTHPIIADDEHFPVAYVTYLRYNNDAGYGGMEYLKFPIKGNGEIDYYNGERTFIRKTDITDTSQVNRQTDTTQEPIELYKKDENGNYVLDAQGNKTYQHYRETTETSAYTLGTEPTTNGGRLWQYPEGEIRTDVMITQIERTAWDYNGDTELTVADLVRRKKVEKSGVNSSLNKACVLGTTLTNEGVDESKASNWTYDENSELDPKGYLPAYRLRRVILTPPSTEVSVLSYNLFYKGYENLNDDTRREAVKDLLGLYRGDFDSYNGGAYNGVFNDYTIPKADIIALQEITVDYWHETLYQNYMAPFQTGTDTNDNKRLDPDEVTSKRYYTYKHVGRGRYGHVFFDEDNGKAYAGESYSVIFYDQTKYEYDQNKGLSGTIYFSDTPTVASYGWGDDTVNSLLDSQRAANWAIFTSKATGESFMFVNVHLSNSEENSSGDYVDRKIVREKQMELLTRKIKEILAQESRQIGAGGVSGGMPVIIAGDFNAYIGADAYSYALEQGYEDARESAVISSENHGAYTNWTQIDETKYAYGDHIFVNKRAEVQTYEVIDEEGDLKAKNPSTGVYDTGYRLLEGTDGKMYHMSDHCPIKATIDVGTDYIRSTTSEITKNVYHEVLGLY